jgi:hypothetical protein
MLFLIIPLIQKYCLSQIEVAKNNLLLQKTIVLVKDKGPNLKKKLEVTSSNFFLWLYVLF